MKASSREIITDREVFFVEENALAACFKKSGTAKPGITEDFVKELADSWMVFDTSGNHPVIIAKTEV